MARTPRLDLNKVLSMRRTMRSSRGACASCRTKGTSSVPSPSVAGRSRSTAANHGRSLASRLLPAGDGFAKAKLDPPSFLGPAPASSEKEPAAAASDEKEGQDM